MSASPSDGPQIVGTVVVAQDISTFRPLFHRVTLELMSDGSVRWREPVASDFPDPENRPKSLGGRAP